MYCPLCNDNNIFLFFKTKKKIYYRCRQCDSISLHSDYYLDTISEKKRYDKHSDTINDKGYISFVSPIVDAVIKQYNPNKSIGLDYGCGKTKIIQYLLEQHNYSIKGYDPIYCAETEILKNIQYNYITCCEVVEHFYYPKQEFEKLYFLLQPKGKLFLKTYLYDNSIEFSSWWYKNDSTHVIFYTAKSLNFIKQYLNFHKLTIFDNHIEFEK